MRTARRLNGMGVRTRHGSNWCTTGVNNLVSNAVYIGEKRANYLQRKGSTHIVKPKAEWVTHAVEPIIDLDTWEAARRMIEKRINSRSHWSKRNAPPRESTQLYGGILACGCDGKMYMSHNSKTKGKRYVCRACRRAVWESAVTDALLQALNEITITPEEIAKSLESRRPEYLAAEAKAEQLQREAEKVKKKRDRMLDLYADG